MGLSFTITAGHRQAILRSESRRTHDNILRSQIRDSPKLEGQVPVFISLRKRVARLYPQRRGSLFVASYGGSIQPRLHTGLPPLVSPGLLTKPFSRPRISHRSQQLILSHSYLAVLSTMRCRVYVFSAVKFTLRAVNHSNKSRCVAMYAYSCSAWECVHPAVGWQWTFAPTSLFRLSGVMSQCNSHA
jgi:hypothetical protein